MRTAKSIIDSFTERVENREAIPPDYWLQAAQFLNVLIGEEQYKLAEYEQAYTKQSLIWIEANKSNAEAEKRAKTTNEFLNYRKQTAFCKQIEEFIRLAKKMASIALEQGA